MAQQEKLTKLFDLKKSAATKGKPWVQKLANYSVVTSQFTDSGKTIVPNNSGVNAVHFFLPPVNACNGHEWDFYNANTVAFYIHGDTNVVVSRLGLTSKIINCTDATNTGFHARLHSDGVKYYFSRIASGTNTSGYQLG